MSSKRTYPIKCLLAVLLFLGAMHTGYAQFYNGSQVTFGKNRIQYDEFLWSYYRFDRYDIYFYTGGKEIADYTARVLPAQLQSIEKVFDYQLDDRVKILVYNKYADFRQSNLGLASDEQYNVGGITRVIDQKLSVYYEGDHENFNRQLRSGIAQVVIGELMYGGNWREMLKNSTFLTLPDWYLQGLISYAANGLTPEVENRIRDGVLSGRYKKFNRLTGTDAAYAGHALWNYIAQVYGAAVIPNILYMARVSRNIESGFLFVLGLSLRNLIAESNAFYERQYQHLSKQQLAEDTKLRIRSKKNRTYSQFKLSPDGNYAIYTTHELGQAKVYLYDVAKRKSKKLKTWGHKMQRINDETYPLVAWHPKGTMVSLIAEEKGEMVLYYYSTETGKLEKTPVFNLQEVIDFAYSPDGKQMVFSAVANGQTDIFLYNVGANTQVPVTKDIYDDLNPRFLNSRQIIFASNRPDDTLRVNPKTPSVPSTFTNDLFVYDLVDKSTVLKRFTSTPHVNEMQPMPYKEDKVSFLAARNGVTNRYLAAFDSVISHIDTATHYRYITKYAKESNYPTSILEHEVVPASGHIAEMFFRKGKYEFHKRTTITDLGSLKFELPVTAPSKPAQPAVTPEKPVQKTDPAPAPSDSVEINIDNYRFSTEQVQKVNRVGEDFAPDTSLARVPPPVSTAPGDTAAQKEIIFPNQRNYFTIFYPEKVVTQIDLSYVSESYQPFFGTYLNPGMSGLFRMSASNLFEDKRITGIIHPSISFGNSQYILMYEDRTRRLDKTYLVNRQAMSVMEGFARRKYITNEAKYIVKWPFSEVAAVRATANFRHNRVVSLASDERLLAQPDSNAYWGSGKLEYIFDNTLIRALNIRTGTRMKLFAEFYKAITVKETDMFVIGGDLRTYLKIHRSFIWANRFAASTSFGNNKLLYFMGGVDSWLNPKPNEPQSEIDFSQQFAYQTIATPVRGFGQNARNGKSFAVINSELRLPVFKYFSQKPLKSDFKENFTIIGFTDVGAAWNGTTPYSDDNIFNKQEVVTQNIIIRYQTQKEPIIGGYGFGVRSRIMGYFVRLDWAWGVEDYEIKDRMFYLSLSLDF